MHKIGILIALLCLPWRVTIGMPLILHIISDDLNDDYWGPTMLNLQQDATNYINAHSDYPVCSPSRSAFLTGLYPNATGAYTFIQKVQNNMTIPLFLKEHGWQTVGFGKVFHGPFLQGVSIYADHWTYGNLAYEPDADSQCRGGFIGCVIPLEESADWLIADTFSQFFETTVLPNLDKAWYIAVGFRRPHWNNAIAQSYLDEVTNPELLNETLLTNVLNLNYYECHDLYVKYEGFPPGPELIVDSALGRPTTLSFTDNYPTEVLRIIRYYQAAVLHMDGQLRTVLNVIKKYNVYDSDETLIIFHGDHGFNLGRYGMWCKNSLYDGATRVPMMIKGVGFGKNATYSSPIALTDLFPTIIQFAGYRPEVIMPTLVGKSLFGAIESDETVAYSQYPRCSPLGELQISDCMTPDGDNACKTMPKMQYMGYKLTQTINKMKYDYVTWRPFHADIYGCGVIVNGTTAKFPLLDPSNSKADWKSPPVDPILLRDGEIYNNDSMIMKFEALIISHYSL